MTRTLFLALVLALTAAAAVAAEEPAPRFLIERIEVRNNKRVSSQIILAESLLREGAEYSEAELRDAAARLNRLPFLLAAEFALEKGSERGKHVLVISIAETKWFFFNLDMVPVFEQDDRDNSFNLGGGATTFDRSGSEAALGVRFFVGRRGAIHAGLFGREDNREYTIDDGAIVIGYTQYDILGTRAFATLNLKNTFGQNSPQIVAGVPLSLNQTLTLTYDVTRTDHTNVQFASGNFRRGQSQRLATLRWSHNTTDQPFLPTRGTLLHVTPVVVWRDDSRVAFSAEGERRPVVVHSRATGLDAGVVRYWPLSDRNTVSAGLEAGWARVDHRENGVPGAYDATYAIAGTGFSHSLRDRNAEQRHGYSRLELNVSAVKRSRSHDRFAQKPDEVQLTAAWVRRNAWGKFRLGAGLSW